MKKNTNILSKVIKAIVFAAVIFTLSLPVSGKECKASGNTYRVNVSEGYLALRSARAYDDGNEIGQLYSGDVVEVSDYSDPTYWYVYSSKYGRYGYVNKAYLVADTTASTYYWTVKVDKGYLALRSAMEYDSRNEIGELYSGDMVEVVNSSDSTYWYVYSPKLGKFGYVNQEYLLSPAPAPRTLYWTVKVDKGYLALRSAKAYDEANEIGELYSGDIVEVSDSSDSTYWYVYSPKHGRYGYVNREYLLVPAPQAYWTVSVDKGYLALRSERAYDESNETGQLYSGDVVEMIDSSDSTYWYVYSPKLGKAGYVNREYLLAPAAELRRDSVYCWTVRVDTGYLALRTEAAYDEKNEIGQLYTGDTVEVYDTSESVYWYVYSPKLGKYGFVNKAYLY